ncbi:Uncharacterised protein [Mycobacterium tuberculosis]|nr:Uncharacterised protein [Mycobacterium tuberculosis]
MLWTQIGHLQQHAVTHAGDDRVDAAPDRRAVVLVEVAGLALPQHRQRPRGDRRGDQVFQIGVQRPRRRLRLALGETTRALVLILAGSDRFGEQRLLVVVVAIQRARGHPGRLGNVLQFDRMEATFDEQSNGLIQNLLLPVLWAAPNGLGDGCHRLEPPSCAPESQILLAASPQLHPAHSSPRMRRSPGATLTGRRSW